MKEEATGSEMAPARSFQDEKMDRNACDAVLVDSLRTDTGTG